MESDYQYKPLEQDIIYVIINDVYKVKKVIDKLLVALLKNRMCF
jgi:hypothetical protein